MKQTRHISDAAMPLVVLASFPFVFGVVLGAGCERVPGHDVSNFLPIVSGDTVYVELELPGFPATMYALPQGSTLGDLFGAAGFSVPPNAQATIVLHSGMAVEVHDREVTITRMPAGQLVLLGIPFPLWDASVEDLSALEGIGPRLAQRIVDYIAEQGPPAAYDELAAILGMTMKRLDILKAATTLEPSP